MHRLSGLLFLMYRMCSWNLHLRFQEHNHYIKSWNQQKNLITKLIQLCKLHTLKHSVHC